MGSSQRGSHVVVVEVLEIAFGAFLFHQTFEPPFRGLLFAGMHDAVDFELVNELLDIDLYRRIADVVGLRRGRLGLFGLGVFVLGFFFELFFFFFRLFDLDLHSSLRLSRRTVSRSRRLYKPAKKSWQYPRARSVNGCTM